MSKGGSESAGRSGEVSQEREDPVPSLQCNSVPGREVTGLGEERKWVVAGGGEAAGEGRGKGIRMTSELSFTLGQTIQI